MWRISEDTKARLVNKIEEGGTNEHKEQCMSTQMNTTALSCPKNNLSLVAKDRRVLGVLFTDAML